MTSLKWLAFSIIVLLSTQRSAVALDNPTYQSDILAYEKYILGIPSVDTPEKVGRYRDVIMRKKNDGSADWTLISYLDDQYAPTIRPDKVELITTDTLPRRFFLRMEGSLDCGIVLGKVVLRVDKGSFNITSIFDILLTGDTVAFGDGYYCSYPKWTYRKTIELPALGLKAGTYAYTVNGTHKGEFRLEVENNLPGYPADVTWHPSYTKGRPQTNLDNTLERYGLQEKLPPWW
jgi:hypothetical protein